MERRWESSNKCEAHRGGTFLCLGVSLLHQRLGEPGSLKKLSKIMAIFCVQKQEFNFVERKAKRVVDSGVKWRHLGDRW